MTGVDVVHEVCEKIRQALLRDCNRWLTDSYARYVVKAKVELQLEDIDTLAVCTGVQVGSLNPRQPSHHIVVDTSVLVAADTSVEPRIDDAVEHAPAPNRQYVSTHSQYFSRQAVIE